MSGAVGDGATAASAAEGAGRAGAVAPTPEAVWAAADGLGGELGPARQKHVVMGLVFLRFVSELFDDRRAFLALAAGDPQSEYFAEPGPARQAALEDREAYTSAGLFWIPAEARWAFLASNTTHPEIGRLIDEAMEAIERENPAFHGGMLPRDFARADLDSRLLGELVDLVGEREFTAVEQCWCRACLREPAPGATASGCPVPHG